MTLLSLILRGFSMITLIKNKHLCSNNVDVTVLGNTYIDSNCEIESPVRLNGGYFSVGKIGAFSYVSGGAVFKGVKSIGRFCSIAPDVAIGYGSHNYYSISTHPLFENIDVGWNSSFHNLCKNHSSWLENNSNISRNMMAKKNSAPVIGNDVYIGKNAFIGRGVTIGDGAVIGAHAVVVKDVLPYSIVAGVPAKLIKFRFSLSVINELLKIQWWDYGPDILAELDIFNPKSFVPELKARIQSGLYNKYFSNVYSFDSKFSKIYLISQENKSIYSY